jgi:hypothetical protein
MRDLIKLYLFALRSGDRPLARVLARALRSEAPLREHADVSLQDVPRGPTRWSAGAQRAVSRVVSRLGSALF